MANINDSDDLEDLDYGDDDYDFETKNEQSQNSGPLGTSTQDIDDEGDEEIDDEEQDDDDDEITDRPDEEGIRRSIRSRLGEKVHPNRLNRSDSGSRGTKRKRQIDDEDEDSQNCDQSRSDKSNLERCKFWPYCTAGDECSFYHPTKPCRTFPNCRFGTNCLYIHPPCKYLPFCTRSDCPFAHPVKQTSAMLRNRSLVPTGPRQPIPIASQFKPPALQQAAVPKCKFGFKCSNLMCKFSHQASEPCRYGANCLLENCAFTHPEDHQQAQQKKPTNVFKWTAKS